MNVGNVEDMKRGPAPKSSPLFSHSESRRPPSSRLRMWVVVAVVEMFVLFCAVAPVVCPEDVGWFRSTVAVLCGTFGRMVIGGCHNGFFDCFCVSMVVCSAICFWGKRGPGSLGCISTFFLFSWLLWFLYSLSYLTWWC